MSKFSLFMKENKKEKENEFYAPTSTLCDENGEPLKWEFKHITSKQNEELRDANTIEVPIPGKPNMFRQKVNTRKYIASLIVASTVFPDLYDSELQDSYGVKTPEDLLFAMVNDVGEYQDLTLFVNKLQGFDKTLDDKVDEAKN